MSLYLLCQWYRLGLVTRLNTSTLRALLLIDKDSL